MTSHCMELGQILHDIRNLKIEHKSTSVESSASGPG